MFNTISRYIMSTSTYTFNSLSEKVKPDPSGSSSTIITLAVISRQWRRSGVFMVNFEGVLIL